MFVADGVGGAFLAWTGYDGGLVVQRLSSAGVAEGWRSQGTQVSHAHSTRPVLVPDRDGGVIAIWEEFANNLIYAARLYGSGGLVEVGPGGGAANFRLVGSRPNPSASATTITFELGTPARIRIQIFDLQGRLVRAVSGGEESGAGTHTLIWDGHDDAGRPAPSGVYVVRLTAGARSAAGRIVLAR